MKEDGNIMKTMLKLLSFGLIVISISKAGEISYDLRANIFQAKVYSASDTNWTNIDVYYVTNPDGWQEPIQAWGSFDRRNGSSGGIQKNSIFAHPDYEGQVSATVAEYTLTYPSSISTYYGLSDNQAYNYGDVRFVIQIIENNNYITILDSIVADGDFWRYFEYDLTPWYNSEIVVRMITDPNGVTWEDWAFWGESVITMDYTPITVYVSQSGDDSTGNGSEENPYATIQWGIEMAITTDTLIIDDGTYFENLYIYGKDLTISSNNGPEYCTIDGNQNGRVIDVSNCKLFLNGFTISNGYSQHGGGLRLSASDIHIQNCIFTDNQASGSEWSNGGAINYQNLDSTKVYEVIINNCVFENNTADTYGGAVTFETSSEDSSGLNVIIDSCYFYNNSSESRGALGIKGLNTNFNISNSQFTGNIAFKYAGSAIRIAQKSNGIISDCLFDTNIAYTSNEENPNAGSVHVGGGAEVNLLNCTFVNNTADWGAGLLVGGGGIASITNCIFWENDTDQIAITSWEGIGGELTVNYCDIQNGIDSINVVDSLAVLVWGTGNIEDNPLFCNPDSSVYTLAENSPCVGTGENGENIGAYDIGCSKMSISDGNLTIPNKFSLYHNYPNPFNPVTTISYQIPELLFVNLSIFNINSQLVSTLVNEQVQPGNYSIKWDAKDFSSGVYFYKIIAGKYTETGKAILLK